MSKVPIFKPSGGIVFPFRSRRKSTTSQATATASTREAQRAPIVNSGSAESMSDELRAMGESYEGVATLLAATAAGLFHLEELTGDRTLRAMGGVVQAVAQGISDEYIEAYR